MLTDATVALAAAKAAIENMKVILAIFSTT
jgi:hypothetical protein